MSELASTASPIFSAPRLSGPIAMAVASARATLAGYLTPPILIPLSAAAAIAAYGFYLRLL